MSAFVISTETMHRVVKAVLENPQSRAHRLLPKDPTRMGTVIYTLNIDAVNYRYPYDTEDAPPYEYRDCAATPVELHKALDCLLYQCSEGNVPEQPVYVALQQLATKIAEGIVAEFKPSRRGSKTAGADGMVRSMPEWERAPWDFHAD